MKFVFTVFVYFTCINLYAQDFIFFSDSPSNNFYDPSFGFVSSPSTLELVNSVKAPVSTSRFYSGFNSIRLNWASRSGGDWGLALAEEGWPGHDISVQDSLSFFIFSEDVLQPINLPALFLEDIDNVRTPKIDMSVYVPAIPANEWVRVFVPLSAFESRAGSTDLTKIKTVFFAQSASDGTGHTAFIDEVRMVRSGSIDDTPPRTPSGIIITGYGKHIDIKWDANTEPDIMGYYIYKHNGTSFVKTAQSFENLPVYMEWIGTTGKNNQYRLSAFDSSGNESALSQQVSATTRQLSDDEYLTMVQEATFRYFWNYAHPASGMARERLGSGNTVTTGGTGFGIMSIPAAIERGFITRHEGAERVLKILNFLNDADRFHGAWPHWMNGATGKVIPFSTFDNGGDLVETAFLIQGILTIRQYFNDISSTENQIRGVAESLWKSVEWDWYKQFPSSNYLYWHWSPDFGWQMNMKIQGFNEAMITYLLAVASPTYHVSPNLYYLGWAGSLGYKNGKTFYGYTLDVGKDFGGPLFWAHYSFLGFDPRNKKDTYTNYFKNSRNQTLINRAYVIDNPEHHLGYGPDTWGLTASDNPDGYDAQEPIPEKDNGTITPTAALSSFPYTPVESMSALKSFYNNYGERLWGIFGFKDAFNLDRNWFADSYLAIDQGPIIVMIENYRSALLWNNFMANPEIQPMLDSIGFVPDLTSSPNENIVPAAYELKDNYPNPFNPATIIEYSVASAGNVELSVFDITGMEISKLVNELKEPGSYKINFNASGLAGGVYFYRMKSGNFIQTKKLLLLK